MDDAHLVYAARYVSLNPVRARLVKRAAEWRWSSVRAHLAREDDGVVQVAPILDRIGDFAAFLQENVDEAFTYATLRKAESIGRPVARPSGWRILRRRAGRKLALGRRGPKPAGVDLGLYKLSPTIAARNRTVIPVCFSELTLGS